MPDEQRDEKIVEGCQLYGSAPERAEYGQRTISLDELTGVQAVERKYGDLPMQLGHVLRREAGVHPARDAGPGRINFDVVSGHIIEPSWGSTRTEEDGLAHMRRLVAREQKATKWHLILDHLNIHQSESLVRWVAEREGIAPQDLGVKGKSGILHSMESRAAFLHDLRHQVVFSYTRHPCAPS